jgi:DNA-binding YbaB/EbfC family protein
MAKDMQRMMREAQKMAAEMQKTQDELAEKEFEGRAGGGVVVAKVGGDQQLRGIVIDPGIFEGEPDEDDIEMLADAVMAAVNDAMDKARAAQQEALGPLAGGLGGLGL